MPPGAEPRLFRRDPTVAVEVKKHISCRALSPNVTTWVLVLFHSHLNDKLHDAAHAKCFIANSVNFEVQHQSEIVVESAEDPGNRAKLGE